MKIDFVVPGFSKCGTTTLCALLHEHPQICVAKSKEPNYFAENFKHGEKWFESQFFPQNPQQIFGEGSTYYSSEMYAQIASQRIIEHSPDVRLIFMVRDPFTRLESSYREMHHSGHLYGITADLDIGKTMSQLPNMLADTHYWRLLNAFRRHVPDDRILFVFLEEFEENPEHELKRCFEFLRVDPFVPVKQQNTRLNPGSEKRYDSWLMRKIRRSPWLNNRYQKLSPTKQAWWNKKLSLRPKFTKPVYWSPELRQRLETELAPEALALLKYAGRPANHWSWCEKYATTQVRNAA